MGLTWCLVCSSPLRRTVLASQHTSRTRMPLASSPAEPGRIAYLNSCAICQRALFVVLGEGFRGFLALKSRCKSTTVGLRSTNGNENFLIFLQNAKYQIISRKLCLLRYSATVLQFENGYSKVKRKFYIYILYIIIIIYNI